VKCNTEFDRCSLFLYAYMKNRYVKDSFANRFSLYAFFKRLSRLPIPGKEYASHGYHIHEIGPKSLSGKGLQEFAESTEKFMAQGRGGCPFNV
jgi:hypothetical protein